MQGFVQVYTGDGKGKTTAALGLALRAAGAGLRVYFGQFIKNADYSEIKALARFADCITVRQFGRGCFLLTEPARRTGLRPVGPWRVSARRSPRATMTWSSPTRPTWP